jgi:hypothetical protein
MATDLLSSVLAATGGLVGVGAGVLATRAFGNARLLAAAAATPPQKTLPANGQTHLDPHGALPLNVAAVYYGGKVEAPQGEQLLERLGNLRRVGAAGLRHLGLSAAFAAGEGGLIIPIAAGGTTNTESDLFCLLFLVWLCVL